MEIGKMNHWEISAGVIVGEITNLGKIPMGGPVALHRLGPRLEIVGGDMPSGIYGMIWRQVIRMISVMMGTTGMILVPLSHHHDNGIILEIVA
jgi:hypothetical protein